MSPRRCGRRLRSASLGFAPLRTAWGRDLSFEAKLLAAQATGRDWFQPLDISLPNTRIEKDTPFHFGPAVFDLLTCPRLLDMVEALIGPEITSTPIQHVRIKPPEATLAPGEVRAHVGGTDWHQDRAVAHAEADETTMVTVWLAMTEATPREWLPAGQAAEVG